MQYLILMTDIEGERGAQSGAEQDRILEFHREFRSALEAAGSTVAS